MSSSTSSSTSFSLKMRTALIGSPTYPGASKRTVFTRPRVDSNRQGMTRALSMRRSRPCGFQLCVAAQHVHAEAMALFRVELRAEHPAALQYRGELAAVVGHAQRIGRLTADRVIGVHEVEALILDVAREYRVVAQPAHDIPAQVRYSQAGILDAQAAGHARHQRQTGEIA